MAAVATYGAWVVFVRQTAGFFYSHETEMYRQFVWIADCAAVGLDRCAPKLRDNAWAFVNTLGHITLVPLTLICATRVARYMWSGGGDATVPVHRGVGLALVFHVAVTAAFLALMGGYIPRMYWLLIPALLLVLAIELQQLRAALPRPGQRGLTAVVFVASLLYLLVLVSRQGPYT